MNLVLPSKLRIAVDVDGVLLNTSKLWIKKYNDKYDTNHTIGFMDSWDFHKKIGMSKKEFFKILKKCTNEILDVEPCFELASYYLFLLRENHIDIVTGSLADKELLKKRLDALNIRQGIEYEELYQLHPDKKDAKLNLKYDIYIDDNPKLAEAIDNNDGYTFQVLVSQPWNRNYIPKRNVMRAYNWEDVIEAVNLFKKLIRTHQEYEPIDS